MAHRILITGASGFIGRNLAELYQGRYEVHAPSRQELDLLDETAVRDYLHRHRFDAIIHAATGRSNRKTTSPDLFKNNCRMFFNFARCHDLYGRMLHYGSGAEFDRRGYIPLMPETYFDTHVPTDDYAFAKYIAAAYTEAARNNIYNLRLFGVFGKYEAWDVRFISNACCRVLCGAPITLRQNVLFDYLYVNDLARLTTWFLEHEPRHRTYNVCSGQAHELLSLGKMVAEVSGREPEIRVASPGMGLEYSGANGRMLEEIGAFEFTAMKTAIAELYTWYESNIGAIDPDLLRFDG